MGKREHNDIHVSPMGNNGNDIEDENDNDRKEGDYETGPFPYQQPERHRSDSSERSLMLKSQESAGSIHSNHSVTGTTTMTSTTANKKNTTVKSEDLPYNDLKNKKNGNNDDYDDDDTPNSPI